MVRASWFAAAGLFFAVACKDDASRSATPVASPSPSPSPPSPSSPPPSSPPPPSPPPVAPADVHAASEPAPVADVPALSLAASAPEQATRAQGLNARGVKSHRAKHYPAAMASYRAALEADPGHVLARYNLACVYALTGDATSAIAQLEQFAKAGCVLCKKRLVRAREDADFDGIRGDPRFTALVDGVTVEEPGYAAAAQAAALAIGKGDFAPFEATLAAGRWIRVRITYEDLSDGDDPPRPRVLTLASEADLERFADQTMEFEDAEDIQCQGECCTLAGEPGDATHAFREMCFWPESADRALLVGLELHGG
jgi:hypothetical protein